MKSFLFGLPLIFSFLARLLALGEIFKIETTGVEYCGHFDTVRFNASNNTDLWVFVVSETELTVSLTPNFAAGTTFTMLGRTYQTGITTAEFIGGVHFPNDAFATIEGKAKFNKNTLEITSLTGTFIQDGVLEAGCFSSGKFKSQRIA